ncbi:phosphoglycerate dehydrogenase [Anaerotardibacter muris]|uniref:phosphoglycerate dehydrogenase n=1 Tax=Anaerotardibacter muris TaxID=2941505 RepID=UPI00203AD075|nr:phosphoglycerate dehydrogenase [Anaerotardibacter muris]
MAEKILVTEEIVPAGIEILRDKGYQVDCMFDLSREDLLRVIKDYDALIVRSATKVDREIFDVAKKLRIVGRAGVGIDNIDIEAANAYGVIVCNAPVSNTVSAAEHAFALMLAAARNIAAADACMKKGGWNRRDFTGTELYHKTLAIFGLGRIGGLVADRARAFGMNVIAYDPYCSRERAAQLGVTLYDSIEEVLPIADFITVHLPATDETIGMFGPEEFAMMKDGVILVNAARGGIYDVKALSDFIAAGKVAACGIDEWEEQPCYSSPLHEFEQATLTPHLGALTREAQYRAGTQIAEYVADGLSGSVVATSVNSSYIPSEVLELLAPYAPVCKLMGAMLSQVNRGELPAVLSLTTAGALAGLDTGFLAAAALDGYLSSQEKLVRVTPTNVDTIAQRHGIRIETHSIADALEYSSSVKLSADDKSIIGTVSGLAQTPRIVSFMGYQCDIAPGDHCLIMKYVDSPGRVGSIGTILGDANVNITTMQVSTKQDSDQVLVFMNIESDLTDEVIAQLRDTVDLQDLWVLNL